MIGPWGLWSWSTSTTVARLGSLPQAPRRGLSCSESPPRMTVIARSVPVGIARGLHARPAESRRWPPGRECRGGALPSGCRCAAPRPEQGASGPGGDKVGRGKPSSARQIWASVAALNAARPDLTWGACQRCLRGRSDAPQETLRRSETVSCQPRRQRRDDLRVHAAGQRKGAARACGGVSSRARLAHFRIAGGMGKSMEVPLTATGR